MVRAFLPLSVLTLFVASSTFTHAQSGAQKRVLWPNIASISVPKSVMLGSYQDYYYLSPISSGESLMLAGNIYWNDRAGKTTIQQQVAAEKAYMKRSGAKLLSESYLSMGRVWTADFESIEQSGKTKFVYRSRVRISKAPKGFIESRITGQAQAWETPVFKNVFLPIFNSLEVVGLSTPGGNNSSGGSGATPNPSAAKLQNVSAKIVGRSVEYTGYDPVAKRWVSDSTAVSAKVNLLKVDPASGVVAWVTDTQAGYAVYDPDPKVKRWQEDWETMSPAQKLKQLEVGPTGVVAFVNNTQAGYAVYDSNGNAKRWVEGWYTVGAAIANLSVSVPANGGVNWTYNWLNRRWSERVTFSGGRWSSPQRN